MVCHAGNLRMAETTRSLGIRSRKGRTVLRRVMSNYFVIVFIRYSFGICFWEVSRSLHAGLGEAFSRFPCLVSCRVVCIFSLSFLICECDLCRPKGAFLIVDQYIDHHTCGELIIHPGTPYLRTQDSGKSSHVSPPTFPVAYSSARAHNVIPARTNCE